VAQGTDPNRAAGIIVAVGMAFLLVALGIRILLGAF
jgi:hypothetical protein